MKLKLKRSITTPIYFLAILLSITFQSCKSESNKDEIISPALQPEKGEAFSGGHDNTVFDLSPNAFSFQSPGLSGNDELLFFVGNSFFNQSWVSAPASTTARDGVGPTFNAFLCSSCHFKDGRGRVPYFEGEKSTGLLIRMSVDGQDQNGGPMPHPTYGSQLQDKAILGVKEEGEIGITYQKIYGSFANGKAYELDQPIYRITNTNFGAVDASTHLSPRIAQQMIGMGLIEAIDEASILAHADEFDADGDGISGKANFVWDAEAAGTKLGRFGWKANQPSVRQQVAGAFSGDMGITTSIFPFENCPSPQLDCGNAPNGGSPEITTANFDNVVLYSRNLAVPGRRNHDEQAVLLGKQIFNQLECGACHVSSFTTTSFGVATHFRDQKIFPYSDFLLHDMGPDLADGYQDYLADGQEWRTQPLWGIGLIETVNGHSNLMHDGRAKSIEDAILWHGGEAQKSKDEFLQLDEGSRNQLLLFLKSL